MPSLSSLLLKARRRIGEYHGDVFGSELEAASIGNSYFDRFRSMPVIRKRSLPVVNSRPNLWQPSRPDRRACPFERDPVGSGDADPEHRLEREAVVQIAPASAFGNRSMIRGDLYTHRGYGSEVARRDLRFRVRVGGYYGWNLRTDRSRGGLYCPLLPETSEPSVISGHAAFSADRKFRASISSIELAEASMRLSVIRGVRDRSRGLEARRP